MIYYSFSTGLSGRRADDRKNRFDWMFKVEIFC